MTVFSKKVQNSTTLKSKKHASALNSKELGLNKSNSEQKHAKTLSTRASKHGMSASKKLIVQKKTIRVLLDSGSSGDLLFLKKGASNHIPVIRRAIPQSWGTSNGTFITDKVGRIEIAFVDYSSSKRVHLAPDIVEYKQGINAPMYDLIIGKSTMHDIGVILDFKESTIQIDEILLPMRDIADLQLKSSITRALRNNTNHAQEPVSTRTATKRVVEILDAKTKKQIFQL